MVGATSGLTRLWGDSSVRHRTPWAIKPERLAVHAWAKVVGSTGFSLNPRPLVGDLLGDVNRPRRHHLHRPPQLELRRGWRSRGPRWWPTRSLLGFSSTRKVRVSWWPSRPTTTWYRATPGAWPRLVGLARVDEHTADLGDLVGAAAPAQHPGRGTSARAGRVVDDREIAGGEADHRVRVVVHGRHDLADLPGGQRLAALGIAHLDDGILHQVHARLAGHSYASIPRSAVPKPWRVMIPYSLSNWFRSVSGNGSAPTCATWKGRRPAPISLAC